MFWYMPRTFGSLSNDENYFGFLVCFSQDNFFRLTGLKQSVLFSERINDYSDFFRYIMDLYAQKEGKGYWLQKANSLHLDRLYREFPDAKFIIIQREIEDNIRSTIALRLKNDDRSEPVRGAIGEAFRYYMARKAEQRFQGKDNVMEVKFVEFKANKERVMQDVCAFIGIQYHAEMLRDTFEKNTSFRGGVSRDKILRKRDRLLIRLFFPICRVVPWRAYYVSWAARKMFGNRSKEQRFTSKTFSLLRAEQGWDS
jgi:hypothetical protein